MKRWSLCSVLGLVLALSGCGGHSGSTARLRVDIAWADSSRAINGPAQADFAELSWTTDGGQSQSWSASRPSGSPFIQQTFGPAVPSGTAGTLEVRFYYIGAGAPARNPLAVASASSLVGSGGTVVRRDGHPLGSVSPASTITSLIAPAISIAAGARTSLVISGVSSTGIVALPQKHITLSCGASPAPAAWDGEYLAGLTDAKTTYTARFEGKEVTSALVVTPRSQPLLQVAEGSADSAYDATRGVFWATYPNDHPTLANTLCTVDPATGVTTRFISGLAGAGALGLAADGSLAWVGTDLENGFRKVNLQTGAIGNRAKAPWETVDFLDVNPYAPLEVVADAPTFFRDGEGIALGYHTTGQGVFTTPRDYIAAADYGGPFYRFVISENNFVAVTNNPQFPRQGPFVMIDSHLLLSGDGQFVSADSLGPTGELFPFPTWIHPGSTSLADPAYDALRLLEVDVPNNRAWLLRRLTDGQVLLYTYDYTQRKLLDKCAPAFPTGVLWDRPEDQQYGTAPTGMKRFGAQGLSIRTTSALWLLPTAPGL